MEGSKTSHVPLAISQVPMQKHTFECAHGKCEKMDLLYGIKQSDVVLDCFCML